MAKRRMGIIAFVFCFCLYLMTCQVIAASTADAKEPILVDKNCSLNISCCSDDVAFSDVPVKIYKVADVSKDFQYKLTSSFEKSKLILNDIQTVNEWNVIRSTLETYILANGVKADFNALTDSKGQACFDALKPGLYLAITERVAYGEKTYVFEPSLIALPGLGADGFWQYNVEVTSKFNVTSSDDDDSEIEFKVLKLWKGDNAGKTRPSKIKIDIYRNGTIHETVTLSKENNWKFTWSAKNDGSDWKVVERNIPTKYTMTVEKRENSFVLTNTFDDDVPNDSNPPKTGDTSNVMLYIILMIVSGSMLIILGIVGKRKRV